MTYKIVRKHFDTSHPGHNKQIASGLSLKEAQKHCSDKSTCEKGVWMDVYYEEHWPPKPPSFMEKLFMLQSKKASWRCSA